MGAHMCRRIAPRDRELSIPSLSYGDRSRFRRMERAGNGASGKRCDIDGVTRTGELAGVSESSRDIDGKAARSIERERKSQARRVSSWADANHCQEPRSRLQSRYAFSVAARRLTRTMIRIWNNR